MGFFLPTLGPLGYLVVKERSKCGLLWTLRTYECFWSWGSPRLIGGVPRTEGAQNGVRSKEKKKKKRGRRKKKEKKEGKRRRNSLDLGGRGLSHFEEDFVQM